MSNRGKQELQSGGVPMPGGSGGTVAGAGTSGTGKVSEGNALKTGKSL